MWWCSGAFSVGLLAVAASDDSNSGEVFSRHQAATNQASQRRSVAKRQLSSVYPQPSRNLAPQQIPQPSLATFGGPATNPGNRVARPSLLAWPSGLLCVLGRAV